MKTAIVTSKSSLNHNTGSGHPESTDRVLSIIEKLKKNKKLIWKNPARYNKDIIKDTHSHSYIESVENAFPKDGLVFLDGDTVISPGSKDAASDVLLFSGCANINIRDLNLLKLLNFSQRYTASIIVGLEFFWFRCRLKTCKPIVNLLKF